MPSITNRPSRMPPLTNSLLARLVERVDRGQRRLARPFDIGVDAVVGDPARPQRLRAAQAIAALDIGAGASSAAAWAFG